MQKKPNWGETKRINISTSTPMPPIAPITPPHNMQKKRKRHTATLAKVSIYFLKAGFAWNSGIFSGNYYFIPKDGLFLSIPNKGHALDLEHHLPRPGFVGPHRRLEGSRRRFQRRRMYFPILFKQPCARGDATTRGRNQWRPQVFLVPLV